MCQDPMSNLKEIAQWTILPEGYVPSDNDVICNWKRQNQDHGKTARSLLKCEKGTFHWLVPNFAGIKK